MPAHLIDTLSAFEKSGANARQLRMTIDSNIVIAFIKGEERVVQQLFRWKQTNQPLLLSPIVEAEVLGFPEFSSEERRRTALFLEENFASIPCDRTIAYQAAVLRGTTTIKLQDALIAATALVTNTPLVTRNVKDFKKVPELTIVKI